MKTYALENRKQYALAGSTDLIRLKAVPGQNAVFCDKARLETLAFALCAAQCCHLSGPTAAGKTALIDALWHVPENFERLCEELGFEKKPLKI